MRGSASRAWLAKCSCPDGPTASTGMYEGFCSISAVASEGLRTPQPFCTSR